MRTTKQTQFLLSEQANRRIDEITSRKRMTRSAVIETLLEQHTDELIRQIARVERRRAGEN